MRPARNPAKAVVLASALLAGTASAGPPETAVSLLSTPATQMDVGLDRLRETLLPAFLELHADGAVVWNRETSRIVVRLAMVEPEGDANWGPARRAAASIRRRLGVDADHRRIARGQERRLEDLFDLASAPAPPADELAKLIRLVVAVRTDPNLSPTFYSADLIGGDVQLDIDPD